MISRATKIYGALLTAFLLIAINTPVNFIYWMCAALGSLLITGALLTLSAPGGLSIERNHTETIFQGDTSNITLTLRNESPFVKLFLLVEEYCAPFNQKQKVLQNSFLITFLQRKQPISFDYSITFPRRGVYTLGPCKISSGWPLGLFIREKEISQTSTLYVLPRAVPIGDFYFSGSGEHIHAGEESSTKPGTGTNIYGTREYRPGDSLNHIHWKATAKQQALIMKEFEGTGYSIPMLLLDLQDGTDTVGANGGSALETAVTLCASLAKSFFAKRQPFVFAAQGKSRFFRTADTDPLDYMKLLKELAQVQCDGSMNFLDFVSAELLLLREDVSPILISASKHFWKPGISIFTDSRQMNVHACAMIIDADSFMETTPATKKPSLFYQAHLELKQRSVQSYYISKQTPLRQALSEETIKS